jgi:hypothetical protein
MIGSIDNQSWLYTIVKSSNFNHGNIEILNYVFILVAMGIFNEKKETSNAII